MENNDYQLSKKESIVLYVVWVIFMITVILFYIYDNNKFIG